MTTSNAGGSGLESVHNILYAFDFEIDSFSIETGLETSFKIILIYEYSMYMNIVCI